MGNTDEEQLKDQIEHELDVLQFLDICQISFRELIDIVFDMGVSEELRQLLERQVR